MFVCFLVDFARVNAPGLFEFRSGVSKDTQMVVVYILKCIRKICSI